MFKNDLSIDHVEWRLFELHRTVDSLPGPWRGRLQPMCRWLAEWSRGQERLVRAAQEAVDQFRLDVRYLQFDLDVTRRERDQLRAQLENDNV